MRALLFVALAATAAIAVQCPAGAERSPIDFTAVQRLEVSDGIPPSQLPPHLKHRYAHESHEALYAAHQSQVASPHVLHELRLEGGCKLTRHAEATRVGADGPIVVYDRSIDCRLRDPRAALTEAPYNFSRLVLAYGGAHRLPATVGVARARQVELRLEFAPPPAVERAWWRSCGYGKPRRVIVAMALVDSSVLPSFEREATVVGAVVSTVATAVVKRDQRILRDVAAVSLADALREPRYRPSAVGAGSYFLYSGSELEPPCHGGARWAVLVVARSVPKATIDAVAAAVGAPVATGRPAGATVDDATVAHWPGAAPPMQPLAGRQVILFNAAAAVAVGGAGTGGIPKAAIVAAVMLCFLLAIAIIFWKGKHDEHAAQKAKHADEKEKRRLLGHTALDGDYGGTAVGGGPGTPGAPQMSPDLDPTERAALRNFTAFESAGAFPDGVSAKRSPPSPLSSPSETTATVEGGTITGVSSTTGSPAGPASPGSPPGGLERRDTQQPSEVLPASSAAAAPAAATQMFPPGMAPLGRKQH